MFDGNGKIWGLVVVLAIGISFEMLKNMPTDAKLALKGETMQLLDSQPYSIHEPRTFKKAPAFIPMGQQQPMAQAPKPIHVAADSAVLAQQLKEYLADSEIKKTDSNKKDDKKKKKKKKDDDEYEDVIDPKTGQKIHRKKKKDDPNAAAAAQDPASNFVMPTPANDPNAGAGGDNGNIAAAVAAAAEGNEPPLSNAAPATNNLNTLQEWERLLLQQPNLTETQLFIKDYQSHLVTAEVFYEIVNMMITDSRSDMQQLGVLCAGDTPSAQSFGVLAAVDKAAGSAKANADKFIASGYSTASQLTALQTELSAADSHTQTLAVQQVDVVVKALMGGNTTGTTTANPSTLSTTNSAELQKILPIVQALAKSTNATLSSQAQLTLNDLQTVIAESGGVTQPVASTNP